MAETFKFYRSYVDLLTEDYNLRSSRELTEFEKLLRHSKFRKYYLDKYGYSYASIQKIKIIMRMGMLRPQRLITDHQDFYVASDMMTNTYYINYKNLMMIDIDFYKPSFSLLKGSEKDPGDIENTKKDSGGSERAASIIKIFKEDVIQNPQNCWTLYKSHGGVHAFLNSKNMDYRSEEAIEMMLTFGCDFNYLIYSHLRGWCVRLNRKTKETTITYEPLGIIGNKSLIDKNLQELIDLHLNLLPVFADDHPSMMYG